MAIAIFNCTYLLMKKTTNFVPQMIFPLLSFKIPKNLEMKPKEKLKIAYWITTGIHKLISKNNIVK